MKKDPFFLQVLVLLKPISSNIGEEIERLFSKAAEAVMSGNKRAVVEVKKELERVLTSPKAKDFSSYVRGEVKAKIATLDAVIGEGEWETAAKAFDELRDVIESRRCSCGPCNEIPAAMFAMDAGKAGVCAGICLKLAGRIEEGERKIFKEEAKATLEAHLPYGGYRDYVDYVKLPPQCSDIGIARCVRESAGEGDAIYLVWRKRDGIGYRELINSRYTKDYIFVDEVRVRGKKIVVKLYGSRSYPEIEIPISDLEDYEGMKK